MASKSVPAEHATWSPGAWLQGLLALVLAAGAVAVLVLGLRRTESLLVVDVDGERRQIRTHAPTVGTALRQAGFEVYSEDSVTPGLEADLVPGTVVELVRAQPLTVRADGQTWHLRTHATTVSELLQEARIQTGPADEIWFGDQLVGFDTTLESLVTSSKKGGQEAGGEPGSEEGSAGSKFPLIALRRANSITVEDDGVTMTLHSTADTIGQVFEQYGINLFVGDAVVPGLQDRVTEGLKVAIHRSVPVQIEVDGRVIHTRTRAETVAGVLGQEGIALVGKDTVEPAQIDLIQPDMTIRVTRVHEDLIVAFDPIPFEMIWVPDANLEIDNVRLAQEGRVGLTKRRYRVVYEDGNETERSLEASWFEQPPITKTLAYGTKIVVRTMDTPDGPIEYWRKMRVYTVSYTAKSAGKPKTHPRYGYTALGWKLVTGIVAVDPSVIPLKSWLYVPGYGKARAGDTGGGIKGKFVDLGYSKGEYKSWHWWTDVYLLTPVPPTNQIRWVLPDWPKYPDTRR